MTLEAKLGSYFKPEIIKTAKDLFDKAVVSLSIASDTQIQSFVKAGTGARVKFLAQTISSHSFTANCTCATAKKGKPCKHMWATLLKVEQKYPDFLENRSNIEVVQVVAAAKSSAENERAQVFKAKQAEFKKAQSDRQKQYAKQKRADIRAERKSKSASAQSFPPEVQKALDYFSENGFPLETELNVEAIRFVKKKLSRIFHPDLGGSHAEIVVLNRQVEILENFISKF